MAKFSAGQKLVCIDASDTDGELTCGEVYEVMLRETDYYDNCVKIAGSEHWNEERFTLFEDKKEIMNNATKIPHIHAEMIIAWAGGAEIECSDINQQHWYPAGIPTWSKATSYRIKPKQVFPKTMLQDSELAAAWGGANGMNAGLLSVANVAIRDFITSGQMAEYVESLK